MSHYMSQFFLCLTFLLSLITPQTVGMEDFSLYADKAEALKTKIFPGKILVDRHDGKTCIDYASAIVLGQPGETRTRTVLSCAHVINESREKDPQCVFWFQDHTGKLHSIETVSPLSRGPIIDEKKDVGVFRLYDFIDCNPSVVISPETSKLTTLSTLSYGWYFDPNTYTVWNTKRKTPFCVESQFQFSKNTFVQRFEADRAVQISTKDIPEKRCFDLGKPGSPPQTCLYSSGSAWYTINGDTITLAGITSTISNVDPRDIADFSFETRLHTSNFMFFGMERTCEVFKLRKVRTFENTLTSLGHLCESIYDLCK
jgi:hypothetical protein